jgi:cytochrome c
LKEVLSRVYPNVKTFPNLDKEMKEGNVHPELKEWLTKWYNKYKTHSEYNEMRAMYTYYFKYLHPEEAPE